MINDEIFNREKQLAKRVLKPVEKKLGCRNLIKSFYESGKRRFAIWHKETQDFRDKDGIIYKEEELLD